MSLGSRAALIALWLVSLLVLGSLVSAQVQRDPATAAVHAGQCR